MKNCKNCNLFFDFLNFYSYRKKGNVYLESVCKKCKLIKTSYRQAICTTFFEILELDKILSFVNPCKIRINKNKLKIITIYGNLSK
jgi:hypothetical protein